MKRPLSIEFSAYGTKQVQKTGIDRHDFAGPSIPHDVVYVSQRLGHIVTVGPVDSIEGLFGVGIIEGKGSSRRSTITNCRENRTR